jgi:hypothetical protein
MARGKTLVKQSAVERATRGLLAAAAAVGATGDISVDLANGTVRFHITTSGTPGETTKAAKTDGNEWDNI